MCVKNFQCAKKREVKSLYLLDNKRVKCLARTMHYILPKGRLKMKKRTAILIIALASILFSGCYTQIKMTKSTSKTASRWEHDNYYSRRYRDSCNWCTSWHYYYHYPWWLDQVYWWENYSNEPQSQIQSRRERSERRRGLGDTLDAIFEAIDSNGRDDNRDSGGTTRDNQNQDNSTDDNETRPSRRRGM